MPKTNSTGQEKVLLQQYAKAAPLVLLRFKAQAILLAASGVEAAIIADYMNRKAPTVERWVRDWSKRRLANIFTGHAANVNAAKLMPEDGLFL